MSSTVRLLWMKTTSGREDNHLIALNKRCRELAFSEDSLARESIGCNVIFSDQKVSGDNSSISSHGQQGTSDHMEGVESEHEW